MLYEFGLLCMFGWLVAGAAVLLAGRYLSSASVRDAPLPLTTKLVAYVIKGAGFFAASAGGVLNGIALAQQDKFKAMAPAPAQTQAAGTPAGTGRPRMPAANPTKTA